MSFSDLKNRRGQRFDPSNHLKLPPSTSSLAGSMPNSLGHDAIDCFGGHRPQSISSSAALSCRIHVSQASSLPTFSTPSATPAAITSPSSITSAATLDQSYQFNTKLVPFESKNFKPNKFLNICLNQDFPKKGRGLYSKSSKIIKPGTTLLSLSPHVAALETQFLSSRCSSCFLEDKDFEPPQTTSIIRQIKRCAKCKVVAYCGLNCQRLDWASHKPECAALINYAQMAQAVIKANQKSKSKTAPATDGQSFSDEGSCDQQISNVPSAAVRALGRLLWNKQREEEKDPNWWIGLDELQSQLNVYNSSQKERLMQLSVILSRYVGTQLLLDILSSASTLLPFCCRFLDNTFTLTSTTLDNIGVVFCPSASFINHSCVPNVVVVYPEGGEGASKKVGKEWVKVIAIKNIEPGEEVVTSYVDLAGTRKERQNELAQRYQFICHCSLCKSDWLDQVDPREALKCPKCTNWFSLPPSKCNYHDVPQACGSVDASSPNRSDAGPSSGGGVKKEITCPNCGFSRLIDVEGQRLAIKKSGQALDTVKEIHEKEPAKAAYYAEKAIEWFQMKLLPFTFGPGFYPILELRRMKMVSHLLCKNEQNLKQARAETQQIISGIHLIYGVGHPVSIITKSTIAKLCGWTWRSTIEQNKLESSEHNQDGSKHGNGREREEIELGLKMLEILKQYQCLALEECVIGFGMANGGGRLGRSISHSIQCTEHEITIRKRILKAA